MRLQLLGAKKVRGMDQIGKATQKKKKNQQESKMPVDEKIEDE